MGDTGVRVLRGGVVYGPLDGERVRGLHVRGRVSDSDAVSVGGGPWLPIIEWLAGTVPVVPPRAGAADLPARAGRPRDRAGDQSMPPEPQTQPQAQRAEAGRAGGGFGGWYSRTFSALGALPPAARWPLHAAAWALGGFALIPLLYLAGRSLDCPECGLLWVRTVEGERLLSRRRGFGRVAREDSHYDRDGRYAGATRRTEQVVVNSDAVRVDYACKSCAHRWSAVDHRESEA